MPNGYINPGGKNLKINPTNRDLTPRVRWCNPYKWKDRLPPNKKTGISRKCFTVKSDSTRLHCGEIIPSEIQELLWTHFRRGKSLDSALDLGIKSTHVFEIWNFYHRKR